MQFPEIEDFVKTRRANNGVHSTIIGRRILAKANSVTTLNITAVEYADVWIRGITVSAKPISGTTISSPLISIINKRTSKSFWSNISTINGLNEYPDYLPIDVFSPGVFSSEHKNFFAKKIIELSELIQRNQTIEVNIMNPGVACTVAIALKTYFLFEE